MGCVSSVDNCFTISKKFTKDISLIKQHTVFSFPQLKSMKNKFCSRILHIITAYAKDTYKLKIYLAKLKSLSFILWLIQVIFMANTFYSPKPFRNLTQKSKLALYCHDISVLFKTISVRYIPFFLFSINPAQTHSTFCSDFIYLF